MWGGCISVERVSGEGECEERKCEERECGGSV